MGKNNEDIRCVKKLKNSGTEPEEMSFFLDLTIN